MASPTWPDIEKVCDELITATDAGTILGVSYATILRRIRHGQLKAIVIGRNTWIRRTDVEALA